MKRFLIAAALAATTIATPVLAADVGVSVNVGQPGFYGRLDVGGYPPPQLIYRQPMVVQPAARHRQPIYMRVPPGHAKNWRRHCRQYNACGERVYFVRDNWYNYEYAPRYRKQHRDRRNERRNDHHGYQGNDHGHSRNY